MSVQRHMQTAALESLDGSVGEVEARHDCDGTCVLLYYSMTRLVPDRLHTVELSVTVPRKRRLRTQGTAEIMLKA